MKFIALIFMYMNLIKIIKFKIFFLKINVKIEKN